LLAAGLLLAPTPETRLYAAIILLAFYSLGAVLLFAYFRPAHIAKFPVKPIHLALLLVWFGGGLFLLRQTLKQPTAEARLDTLLAGIMIAVAVGLLGAWLYGLYAKGPGKVNPHFPAFMIVLASMIAALAVVPVVFGNTTPVEMRLYGILIIEFFGVMFLAWFVLLLINTSDTESKTIPDGYAGVVKVKGRVERISFDKSIEVKLKGEEFVKQDLRLHTDTVRANDCMTADHVPADIQASVEWQPINTEAGLRTFYTHSSDPEKAMKSLLRAAIVAEIGLRNSQFICGREDQIAVNVRRRLRTMANEYGVQVKAVGITQALMKHPSPGQSISPLAEASRLQQMDGAVRGVSMTTVQHSEALTNAQASATNNAGQPGKHEDAGGYSPV
jgi:hypothetical protein